MLCGTLNIFILGITNNSVLEATKKNFYQVAQKTEEEDEDDC